MSVNMPPAVQVGLPTRASADKELIGHVTEGNQHNAQQVDGRART